MNLRVFYFFERRQELVLSTQPRWVAGAWVGTQLLPRLEGEDDFIGLLDDAGNVLQILRDPGSGDYWTELPMPERRMSYGKVVSADGLIELLGNLPRRFRPREFSDFRPQPWGSPP